MSIQNKLVWLLFGLLASMGIALVSSGYWVINKIIIQHYEQQFHRELINLKLEIEQAHETLERAGVSDIESYIEGAQANIVKKFESYHFGESGYLYMLDELGKIVYHPDLETGIIEPLELYPDIRTNINSTSSFSYNNQNKFAVFTHSDTWGWTIALVINKKEMFENRDTYLSYVSFILVISVLITLLILRRLVRRVAQRIGNTLAKLKVMESGDLSARFTHFENDEIGVIQHGVNSLIEQIDDEISRRKDTEHQLLKAKESADSANNAKSQFLANMSHEIRTPMNGVIGMTDLVLESNLTKEQRFSIETIRDSGSALLTIINDILDFSRLESGQLDLDERKFSLTRLLNSITNILNTQVDHDNVEFNLQFENPENDYFIGDDGRIRQIIMNLVGNALKFTHQGNVTLKVKINASNNNKAKIQFDVTDTGIGIAQENIEGLLDRFVQADNSVTRTYGGTGLGLAICKTLVSHMNGEMGIESQIGEGSRFWFNITLQCAKNDQTDESEIFSDDITASEKSSPILNILLVEDNVTNQLIARKLIENNGHSVEIANDGLEALAALETNAYDLIFMDIRMPKMDGITATKTIRNLDSPAKNIPIFAMTANATTDDVKECYEAGMNNFVPKPIDSKLFKETLRDFAKSISKIC